MQNISVGFGTGDGRCVDCGLDRRINASLEAPVSEYIETVRPIGASVTVSSPTAHTVVVSAKVLLGGSKTISDVLAAFKSNLDDYLKSTIFKEYRVSYAKVGSILLNTDGVQDYDELTLNSTSEIFRLRQKKFQLWEPSVGGGASAWSLVAYYLNITMIM